MAPVWGFWSNLLGKFREIAWQINLFLARFSYYKPLCYWTTPLFNFLPAPHLVAPDWGSRLARRWFSSTQQDDCQVCHQKRLSENYPLPNLSITFQTCHGIDDEISSLYVYRNRNSWNWRVILMPTIVWQIFNVKGMRWPETEILGICCISENYPLPNLSITFQTYHRIDDEISSLYVYTYTKIERGSANMEKLRIRF